MITIVNYGMGNLGSVRKAFAYLGVPAALTEDPEKVARAEKLIVPGVGAFGDAMENLHRTGLSEAIEDYARTGKPLLGICLGMQLFSMVGEEGGEFAGLGIFPGKTRLLRAPGRKLPQIGWNQIRQRQSIPLFRGVADGAYVYFVHSYCVEPADPAAVAATTEYGEEFCAVAARGSQFGVQFHPEKSSAVGLQMLRNFAELV